MVEFPCVHCGSPVRAPEATIGRKGRCPKCGNAVTVTPPPVGARSVGAGPDDNRPGSEFDFELAGAAFETREPGGRDWAEDGDEPLAPPPLRPAVPASAPATASRRTKPPAAGRTGVFHDFLDFRMLISTGVIRGLWAVGAAALTLGPPAFAGTVIFGAFRESSWGGWIGTSIGVSLAAFAVMVFGNLIWRLICESAILFFKMHETLEQLLDEARP